MRKSYVLEVVKYNRLPNTLQVGHHGWLHRGGQVRHEGYMRAKFKTREDAISYYNRHNPEMTPMDLCNTYSSDWDPYTHRKYIIREDYDIEGFIDAFNPDDNPTYRLKNGILSSKYVWLS